MNQQKLLAHHGWKQICDEPLTICHELGISRGSASGLAAQMIIDSLAPPRELVKEYEHSSDSVPTTAGWPFDIKQFQRFVDTDKVITFTALVPLDTLVRGDIDELNSYCGVAFGDDYEIANTEFRVVPAPEFSEDFDDRFTGDVALQVTCTISRVE
jgi:hypothetical protein